MITQYTNSEYVNPNGIAVSGTTSKIIDASKLKSNRGWFLMNLTSGNIYVHSQQDESTPPTLAQMQAGKCSVVIGPGERYEDGADGEHIYMATDGATATIYPKVMN